jgi:hypothetical protein
VQKEEKISSAHICCLDRRDHCDIKILQGCLLLWTPSNSVTKEQISKPKKISCHSSTQKEGWAFDFNSRKQGTSGHFFWASKGGGAPWQFWKRIRSLYWLGGPSHWCLILGGVRVHFMYLCSMLCFLVAFPIV